MPDLSDPFDMHTPMYTGALHRQLISRAEENKRHMTANAARLLELSQQLQASLRDHAPTPDDLKQLDEIAKLAHQVRESMKR